MITIRYAPYPEAQVEEFVWHIGEAHSAVPRIWINDIRADGDELALIQHFCPQICTDKPVQVFKGGAIDLVVAAMHNTGYGW